MDNRARVRRTAKLCLACLRGIAYYRAGENHKDKWVKEDFWRHNNSNSIDMSVIDWCKVFGDPKAEHYWRKSVADPDGLFLQLLGAANISESEFDDYIKKMREYRDKFLAHLDNENVMHVPYLDIATATAVFLYNHLVQGGSYLQNVTPSDAQKFFNSRLRYAGKKYASAT